MKPYRASPTMLGSAAAALSGSSSGAMIVSTKSSPTRPYTPRSFERARRAKCKKAGARPFDAGAWRGAGAEDREVWGGGRARRVTCENAARSALRWGAATTQGAGSR